MLLRSGARASVTRSKILRPTNQHLSHTSKYLSSLTGNKNPTFASIKYFPRQQQTRILASIRPPDSGSIAAPHLKAPADSEASQPTAPCRIIPKDNVAPVLERFIEASPATLRPYMRLARINKPAGTWLCVWPGFWGLALASPPGSLPDPTLLAIFAAGGFLMRGAGCTVNDMWDKNFDKQVTRTKDRPLARGDLNLFDALVFFGGQLGIAAFLLLQLNWTTVAVGTCAVIPVALYPVCKRVINWPQAVLGAVINWGALMGWTAARGSLDLTTVLPLYGACLAWTLFYDTIYAHQDKVDDALLGLKSSALKLGDQTRPWLAAFAGAMVGQLTLAGYMAGMTWPYYAATMGTAGLLAQQVYTLRIDDPSDCADKFVANKRIGYIMFAGICASTFFR